MQDIVKTNNTLLVEYHHYYSHSTDEKTEAHVFMVAELMLA